jgi:hypothetical protein
MAFVFTAEKRSGIQPVSTNENVGPGAYIKQGDYKAGHKKYVICHLIC